MEIMIAWVLLFSVSQPGNGVKTTSFSPYTYPTEEDCLRVARHGEGGACVRTRIYVPRIAPVQGGRR